MVVAPVQLRPGVHRFSRKHYRYVPGQGPHAHPTATRTDPPAPVCMHYPYVHAHARARADVNTHALPRCACATECFALTTSMHTGGACAAGQRGTRGGREGGPLHRGGSGGRAADACA